MLRTIKYFLLGLVFCFWETVLLAQNNKIDSLLLLLKTTKEDTNKVNLLLEITKQCEMSAQPKMPLYAKEAEMLAEKLNYQKGVASSLVWLSQSYWYRSDYNTTITCAQKALGISLKLKDRGIESSALSLMGWGHWSGGNSEKGLIYFHKVEGIPEAEINKKYFLRALMGISNILWYAVGDHEKSDKYSQKFYALAVKYNDKQEIAHALAGRASDKMDEGRYSEALALYLKAQAFTEQIGDKFSQINSLPAIAKIYGIIENYNKELEYNLLELKVAREISNTEYIAKALNEIGNTYMKKKDAANAFLYQKKSLAIADSINSNEIKAEIYHSLTEIYLGKHDYKVAYDYLIKHKLYSDSVQFSLNSSNVIRAQNQYEESKKDIERELINKAKQSEHQAEVKQQKTIIYSVSIGLASMFVLLFFVFRSYRQKQKANIIITEQKKLVDEKQKEILDSIHYAKRIQTSLLPTHSYINKTLDKLLKK